MDLKTQYEHYIRWSAENKNPLLSYEEWLEALVQAYGDLMQNVSGSIYLPRDLELLLERQPHEILSKRLRDMQHGEIAYVDAGAIFIARNGADKFLFHINRFAKVYPAAPGEGVRFKFVSGRIQVPVPQSGFQRPERGWPERRSGLSDIAIVFVAEV